MNILFSTTKLYSEFTVTKHIYLHVTCHVDHYNGRWSHGEQLYLNRFKNQLWRINLFADFSQRDNTSDSSLLQVKHLMPELRFLSKSHKERFFLSDLTSDPSCRLIFQVERKHHHIKSSIWFNKMHSFQPKLNSVKTATSYDTTVLCCHLATSQNPDEDSFTTAVNKHLLKIYTALFNHLNIYKWPKTNRNGSFHW